MIICSMRINYSLNDSQASKTMMLEEQLQLTETEEERRLLEPLMQKESIVSMWRVARLDVCASRGHEGIEAGFSSSFRTDRIGCA